MNSGKNIYGKTFDLRNSLEEKYRLFGVLPKQTAVEMKTSTFKCQFTLNNDFMKNKELNLCTF